MDHGTCMCSVALLNDYEACVFASEHVDPALMSCSFDSHLCSCWQGLAKRSPQGLRSCSLHMERVENVDL